MGHWVEIAPGNARALRSGRDGERMRPFRILGDFARGVPLPLWVGIVVGAWFLCVCFALYILLVAALQ